METADMDRLHMELATRLKGRRRHPFDIYNAIEVKDPSALVDCTPDGDFGNFERLMGNYAMLYAEVANTSRFEDDGYTPVTEKYARHRSRTNGLFRMDSMDGMKSSLVGARIYMEHINIDSFEKGVFVDSWLYEEKRLGITDLCGLAWVDREYLGRYMRNGVAYVSFDIEIMAEVCCKCGKMILDDRMNMACEHLRKKYNGYKSVYFFKKFDGFSLQK